MPRVQLAITIDTEADHSVNWAKSSPLTFHSVVEAIPNRLQPLFDSYGAKPTYLLTSEVLEDDACVTVLSSLPASCELGTHLHPEYVAPHPRYDTYAGTRSHDFLGHHAPHEQLSKLSTITRLFQSRMGYAPRSFRAGRFGANSATLVALQKLGYLVDTSVTPHHLWINDHGSIDYTHAPEQPYFPSEHDLSSAGELGVLEVPVSVGLPPLATFLSRTRIGAGIKRLRGVRWYCRPVAMVPAFFSARQMMELAKRTIEHHQDRSMVVLNLMLHSMEVTPMATPYVRSDADSRAYLAKIETVLAYCADMGARFETLSSVRSLLSAEVSSPATSA